MRMLFPYAALLVFWSICSTQGGTGGEALGENLLQLPDLAKLRKMNGIDPKPYAQFWQNWSLVTTRYRKDNEEQRFVYANKLAYGAMQSGELSFPDGAVLGKLAFKTKEDPQFPNSFEPSNFTRLQLMVKNKRKFAETDGWSYYIYVDGKPHSPKLDHSKNLACHACHQLVASRDFVFAGPTFMGRLGALYGKMGETFKSQFTRTKVENLSKFERQVVAFLSTSPRFVMLKRMRLFSGSLHESIGPLSLYAQRTGRVYLVVDPTRKKFLAAEHSKGVNARKCPGGESRVYMSQKKKGATGIKLGKVCNGSNKWSGTIKIPKNFLR